MKRPEAMIKHSKQVEPNRCISSKQEVQKQMIGERLFPAISKHQPELAGKITGDDLQSQRGVDGWTMLEACGKS